MNSISCPSCNADVESDLYESTGQTYCPYCGADLSDLLQIDSFNYEEEHSGTLDAADSTDSSELQPLPEKSKIEIIQSTPDRLVLHIPPGGKNAAGIGCFAVMWNGIVGAISAGLLFGSAQDKDAWIAIPFLSLFWLIGLGMAYWWIRSRFMRLFVLLDKSQIALQRTLFGRKWITETYLNENSEATLVESYSQNERPVYRVEVNGTNRNAKFGTALSRKEKNWLCDQINVFLGNKTVASSPQEEISFRTESIANEELAPADLPAESPITIIDAYPDQLRFTFPATSIKGGFWVAILFGLFFSSFWGFGVGGAIISLIIDGMDTFDIFILLFLCMFFLVGMLPLIFIIVFLFGKTTVELTPEELRCRWHSGPVGYRKVIPTNEITSVELVRHSAERHRRSRRTKSANNQPSCVVNTATTKLPVTFLTGLDTSRQVAGLLQHQLRTMGFSLAHTED